LRLKTLENLNYAWPGRWLLSFSRFLVAFNSFSNVLSIPRRARSVSIRSSEIETQASSLTVIVSPDREKWNHEIAWRCNPIPPCDCRSKYPGPFLIVPLDPEFGQSNAMPSSHPHSCACRPGYINAACTFFQIGHFPELGKRSVQ